MEEDKKFKELEHVLEEKIEKKFQQIISKLGIIFNLQVEHLTV